MNIFFADDAMQTQPTRPRMDELVAAGGLLVNADQVGSLERSSSYVAARFGFPSGERFKWSPSPDMWMRNNLVHPQRRDFFLSVLRTCADHHTTAIVVISDRDARTPYRYDTHQDYVTHMLIERVNSETRPDYAMLVADRPGGGRAEERAFLSHCLDAIQNGTDYVKPSHIAVNAVSICGFTENVKVRRCAIGLERATSTYSGSLTCCALAFASAAATSAVDLPISKSGSGGWRSSNLKATDLKACGPAWPPITIAENRWPGPSSTSSIRIGCGTK